MNDINKITLSSIAMDLKRVALGYHRGSTKMAERFLEEAIARKKDVDFSQIAPYIANVLKDVEKLKNKENHQLIAEGALLYSTLIQNAIIV